MRDDDREEQSGHDERVDARVLRVEDRHHRDRADVVDDGRGQQEQPELVRAARAEECEDAEHERRVARHDDAPAVRRRVSGVHGQVDEDRHQHTAERAQRGDDDRTSFRSSPDVVSRAISVPSTKKNSAIARSLTTCSGRGRVHDSRRRGRSASSRKTRSCRPTELTHSRARTVPASRNAALPASLAMNCRTEGVTCGAANRSAGPGLTAGSSTRPHAASLVSAGASTNVH